MSAYAVEPRLWSTVLPLIADAAPSLSTLALTEVDTRSDADAFAFLACLPRLTDIDFTYLYPSWNLGTYKTKAPIPRLNHLVHLRAPITVVERLLSRAHCLPAIRTICVVWKPLHRADINGLIRPMASIARRLSARAVSPRLSLCIESTRIAATAAVMVREMTATQLAYFKGVESIHLEGGYFSADDARSVIAQMIALFPRVKHVSFTTTHGLFPATAVAQFVNSVQATELLKRITVNGESYCLSNESHMSNT
jgi:hypothetical protein